MVNAREIAVKTLYNVEFEGAYSNLSLKQALKESELSQRDKGLVSAIVYGVVQRRLTLEYIISSFSKIKLKKISKFINIILKCGIYQILYMDKIPDSAAVDESVKLARRYGHSASAGFVNGILRNVIRNKDSLMMPTDILENLSVKYSFPRWLLKKWIEDFGEDFTKELAESMNTAPKMCIRVNTLKGSIEDAENLIEGAERGQFIPYALYSGGFDVLGNRAYKDGLVTVQDEAAMLASVVLSPKENDIVIDMCAAPGGKTTHLAQLMNNTGQIMAFDIHPHKLSLIDENAKRMGMSIIFSKCADASVYNEEYKEKADKILVDVPCSGFGIIRKKPDIKWNRNETDDLTKIQYKILTNASKYLKKGGELVYSTCTIDKRENELIIERFLSENSNFEAVDITEFVPEGLKKPTCEKGYITLYPNIDKTDGFFIAKLRRQE